MFGTETPGTREDLAVFHEFLDFFLVFFISSFLACQAVTVAGDGYRGRMSPHTPNERFEGATVLKTLQVHSSPTNNLKTTQQHCFTA